MAINYNQTSKNLYDAYQTNVGISYTGLIYNLDVGYGVNKLYNSYKNVFIELSPNYENKNFTFSTPGNGLLNSNGIGDVSIAFTGSGAGYQTNDIITTIPGIGTDTPSKISVEMWAKINDFRGHFAGNISNSGGMLFSFGNYDIWTGDSGIQGTLGFNAFDATTVGISSATVRALDLERNWKHYVFVMTAGVSNVGILTENKIYINASDQGTLVNNVPGFGNPNNRYFSNGQFKINGNAVGAFFDDYKLNMDVGTVRVYNREISAAEVAQNFNATKGRYGIVYPSIITNGLVMYLDAGNPRSYPGSGTTWTSLVGSGTGTLTNGPTYSSADGGSIVFDGTNDFVLSSTSNGFGIANLPPAASLEIWANVTRKGGGSFAYQKLAGFRNDSNFDFYFLILDSSGATVLTEARIRTSTTVTGIYANFPISYFGKWTHIVFTANVNRTDLYLNGVLVGSNTSLTGSFPATSGNFNVGKNPASAAGGGQSWQTKGNISSVRFYNRALTAEEIQQNFNGTRGRFGI